MHMFGNSDIFVVRVYPFPRFPSLEMANKQKGDETPKAAKKSLSEGTEGLTKG